MTDESWRTRLPDRRPSITREVEWRTGRWTVTVGIDRDGRPREVFADGAKEGSGMAAILSDACVVISIALQAGVPVEALSRSLGEEVDQRTGVLAPASIIGLIVSLIESDERMAWAVRARESRT
jgi:ribonucleoside-diphosphate reductase alpha chain